MITLLSTLHAAGMALNSVFQGTQSAEREVAKDYLSQAKSYIKSLQRPYEDDGIKLETFSARDISPEGVNRIINVLGQDISLYIDNENTNFDDSQTLAGIGFIWGPIY